MANWHGYMAVEDINLTIPQRNTIIGIFQQYGVSPNDSQPAKRMHWRISLDGKKGIFEAEFDEDNLSIARFKSVLATELGVIVSNITQTAQNVTFDALVTPVVTFAYQASNRMRVALFGGVGATWVDSLKECRAYLLANSSEWELSE